MVLLAALVAGCTPPPPGGGINDPYEVQNRRVHEFNRRFDSSIVRPVSHGYGTVVPEPAREAVDNFSENLSLPGDVVNNVLQGRAVPALSNTARFAFNTVLGFGGLLDPAELIGLNRRETDFGETLTVWGVPEGAYMELPLFGPSTERDTTGMIVDFFLDPVDAVLDTPESYYATGTGVLSEANERFEFTGIYDSILYESADSYAQARIGYLQNRRFELGADPNEEVIDPYEDFDVQ